MNRETILKYFSSFDLSSIKTLGKEIIGVLLAVVFAFSFYRFVYLRNSNEIKALDAQARSVRTDMERINSELQGSERLAAEIEKASSDLDKLEGRLKGLKERLPTERNISGLLSEISEGEIKKGIRIISIKPLPPADKGELVRLPFQITMEAGFIQFGDYLERVENMPRLMVVDNFIIEQKDGRSSTVNAQVYLSAYILNRK